jgi:hypothetical protein
VKFNQLVIDKIFPLLEENGFLISETQENLFHFISEKVKLNISYNPREKSGLMEVGERDTMPYPLNDKLIKIIFDSPITIDGSYGADTFVDHVALFLHGDGLAIVMGDRVILEEIEKFVEKESKEYTNALVREQILQQADQAWKDGEYSEFIRLINELEKDKLPASYQMKYKISIRKR